MATSTQDQIDTLNAEIAELTTAITHIMKGGQSYSLMTSQGSGTQRSVTMVDHKWLVQYRAQLRAEVRALEGTRAVKVGANW